MIWIPAAQQAAALSDREVTSPWLIDEFLESYVHWRVAAAAVKHAYEHWTETDGEDQTLAFAAYQAALDGEELAARAYSECAARFDGRTR
jgi:hypothetical protein